MSGPLIIEKAKMFYEDMKLTESCAFSDGWLRNFKQRHGTRQLDISGETQSADVGAAAAIVIPAWPSRCFGADGTRPEVTSINFLNKPYKHSINMCSDLQPHCNILYRYV